MNFDQLYAQYQGGWPDFWGRRAAELSYQRAFAVCGYPVRLRANHPVPLQAADHSLQLFSKRGAVAHKPWLIDLYVPADQSTPMVNRGPLPENLFDHIAYVGAQQWIALHLGQWGHCQAELDQGRARGVLHPDLAQAPQALSRYLLNTLLLNFLIARGLGMVHATALVRDGQVLLLVGEHGVGKSTTALQLALAGYSFLTDSMVFVDGRPGQLCLCGFPVGHARLRPDVLGRFPMLKPLLQAEPVRGETKFAVDLRRLDGVTVGEDAIWPQQVHLCLLSRHERAGTRVRQAGPDAVEAALLRNSLYYDEYDRWQANWRQLTTLQTLADAVDIVVGRDEASLIAAFDSLIN